MVFLKKGFSMSQLKENTKKILSIKNLKNGKKWRTAERTSPVIERVHNNFKSKDSINAFYEYDER